MAADSPFTAYDRSMATPHPEKRGTRARKVFIALCWLPPATWLLSMEYIRSYDGWGAWAAAPLLLPPVVLSVGLGLAGFIAVIAEFRHTGRVDGPLVAASALAASVIVYLLVTNAL